MTAAATRGARGHVKHSPDYIRHGLGFTPGLVELGLREEGNWIDGYAFTYYKHPTDAVITYRETHGGAEATRFYIHPRMFILSD